jgi:fructuronate reductase
VTEHHRSWVIEAAEELSFLADAGVQLVHDVAPFEQRKLWLLNGPHSALAYCGLLVGCPTIADAAENDSVSRFVGKLVDDILEVSGLPAAVQPAAFAADALRRFRNPYLGHTCAQVAADGSRKLPQRFGPVVDTRLARGLGTHRLALVVALWIAAAAGIAVAGTTLPDVAEPEAARLQAGKARDLRGVARLALEGHFDEAFVGETAEMLAKVVSTGRGAMEALT